MISIIIPLYNKEAEIDKALRSVFAQSFRDFELLVVDDGSEDGGPAKAETWQDPRLRLIRQSNAGVSAARNRGVREARYDYIAFLDADDSWEPDYLQAQAELIRAYPQALIYASAYDLEDGAGQRHAGIFRGLRLSAEPAGLLENYFEAALQSQPPLWTGAVILRKDALLRVGGFPEGIRAGEDLLTWARLACNGPVAYQRRPLAHYFKESAGDGLFQTPKRAPQEPDRVGQGLEELLRQQAQCAGLAAYCGRWHQMRANIYMRLGRPLRCLREVTAALRLGAAPRCLAYLPLSLVAALRRRNN